MQIGPIKYNQEEERIFFKSLLLGFLSGLPFGLLIIYLNGFPQYQGGVLNRFAFSFFLLTEVESVPLLITAVLCLSYFKTGKLLRSWRDIPRIIWVLIIIFPVLSLYIAFFMSLLIFPLFDLASWLSPAKQYWLGALLFLPLFFLFMLLFLPDQRPRRIVSHLLHVYEGKAIVSKLGIRSVMVVLFVFVWLLLVFLPLPNVLAVNLALIVGGVLIVIYLVRDRRRTAVKKRSHLP